MPTPFLLITSIDHQSAALEFAKEKKLEPYLAPDADLMNLNGQGEGLPIEAIRELKSNLVYRPLQRKTRTVIMCHLEQASIPAQNALLKTLEEPPEYVNIVAVTTNLEKILPTIQSRCQVVQLTSAAIDISGAEEVVKKLTEARISDRIVLAEEYKDREAALALVDQLIHYYHQESVDNNRSANLQLLLKTKDYLQHNTNPQLTVDNLFLSIN
ncbi:MAG TPA: hypothetical protein VF209_02720 [Patescibacteria group bacterium]